MNNNLDNKIKQDAAVILTVMAKLQSALNSMDDMQLLKGFTHELKKRTNSYMNFLEKETNKLTNSGIMDKNEQDSFVRVVSEMDKIKIKVDIDIKE
jgi:uncharacterized protein YqgQ